MKNKFILPLVLLIAFLSGCSSTQEGKSSLKQIANKRVFEFEKGVWMYPVTKANVLNTVFKEIQRLAPYSHCGDLCERRLNSAASLDVWGRDVLLDIENKAIKLILVNGEIFSYSAAAGGGKEMIATMVHVDFKFDIAETSNKLIFTLYPASEIEITLEKNPIFINYSPLMEGQELEQSLIKLFNDIDPT
ncbi:MAG: hypothetical protein QF552_07070 [Litorilituus sp.]|nr:hypothetical protein [Litorilituus sp.]